MDIGELMIRIRATVEGVDATLNAAAQKVLQFSSQVAAIMGKPLKLNIQDDGLDKVESSAKRLSSAKKEIGEPVKLQIEAPGLKEIADSAKEIAPGFTGAQQSVEKFKASMQAQSDQSAAAFEADVKRRQKTIADTAKASAESTAATLEAQEAIAKSAGETVEGTKQVTEGYASVAPAALEAGEAMAVAGAQGAEAGGKSALGAGIAAGATAAWTAATKILKSVLDGVGSALGSMAVAFVVNSIVSWVQSIANARQEFEKLRKEHEETALALEKNRGEFKALADEYTALANKSSLTLEESARMSEIQSALRTDFGVTATSVRGLTGNYKSLAEAMEAAKGAQSKQSLEALSTVAKEAKQSYANTLTSLYNERDQIIAKIGQENQILQNMFAWGYTETSDYVQDSRSILAAYEERLAEVNQKLLESTPLQEGFRGTLEETAEAAALAGKTIDFNLLGAMAALIDLDASAVSGVDAGSKLMDDIAAALVNAASSTDMDSLMAPIDAFHQKVVAGIMPSESDFNAMRKSVGELEEILVGGFVAAGSSLDNAKIQATEAMASLVPPEALYTSWAKLETTLVNAFVGFDDITATSDTLKNQTQGLMVMKTNLFQAKEAFNEFNEASSLGQDGRASAALDEMNRLSEELGLGMLVTAGNVGEFNKTIELMAESTDRNLLSTREKFSDFMQSVKETYASIIEDGRTPNELPILQALEAILSGGEEMKGLFESLGEFDGIISRLLSEDMPPEEAAEAMALALDTITEAAEKAFQSFGMNADEAKEAATAFVSTLTNGLGVQEYIETTRVASGVTKEFAANADKLDISLKKSFNLANNLKTAKDAVAAYKNLNKEMKKSPAEIAKVDNAVKGMGLSFDGTDESLENIEKGLDSFGPTLQNMVAVAEDELAALIYDFNTLDGVKDVHGNLTANGEAMQAEIDAKTQALLALKALLQALGFSVGDGSSSGGGGGGGGDDPAKEAERLRKEAIEADYRMIEHKRRLNEITFEEELRMLEELRRKHVLNAEEIMDWEEKVYDLKQRIRERDAASIDKTADALIEALSNRYQAMLDAEIERLDASRQAWEDWRDGSVKAIEDQIDALDELSKTEDREKTDQEELRKIAKLRQDIEFEQDDYNRMKLQQQLDQAISAREDRLKKQERDDLKDALRDEIEAINERADLEIEALDKEQEAIEKEYAERMKTAALRAEAEKMIMSSSQKDIIKLIGEYAPDYDALGKTLGEKLLDGFKKKVGNVVDWFKKLNDSLYKIQESAASDAIAASDSFYRAQSARQQSTPSTPPQTIVNQTVQFWEPMETAALAAKRIAQTNEELGAILYGG